MTTERDYTTGGLAKRFGVRVWQVQRLFERGQLRESYRVGIFRMTTPADLPEVEKALREAGYLADQQPAVA